MMNDYYKFSSLELIQLRTASLSRWKKSTIYNFLKEQQLRFVLFK